MLIKDQIRARREQLGLTLAEVARRIDLTEQSLRHWEAGRSNPTKRNAPKLEAALGFQIDWTEGRAASGPVVSSLLNEADIGLLLKLTRLPVPVKQLFDRLADEYLSGAERQDFTPRGEARPVAPFVHRPAQGRSTDAPQRKHSGRPKLRSTS